MPWCPNCKSEYRDGFTICADCNVELINELPPETSEIKTEIINNGYFNFDEILNPTLLISAADEIQCKIIENMLLESDIPCYTKDTGCGTYLKVYLGNTVFGTEIYVSKINFDKANELVHVYLSELDNEDDYVPLKEKDNRSFYIRKTVMKIGIIAFVLIPFVVYILLNMFHFVKEIFSNVF